MEKTTPLAIFPATNTLPMKHRGSYSRRHKRWGKTPVHTEIHTKSYISISGITTWIGVAQGYNPTWLHFLKRCQPTQPNTPSTEGLTVKSGITKLAFHQVQETFLMTKESFSLIFTQHTV
ncbi:hypothetical protein Tco_0368987 [Tanacetum coccineum]